MSDSAHSDSDEEQQQPEVASPTVLEPEFPFNDDLTRLWGNCLSLAASISDSHRRIQPLHFALVLLYGDLGNFDDPRLHGATTKVPSLERPLFWTAIARVNKSALPETLSQHIQATTYKDENELSSQVSIGQAMWRRLQDMPPAVIIAPDVEINATNTILEDCSEATRLVLIRAKEIRDDFDDSFITPHHILLALLDNDDVKQIIQGENGMPIEKLADAVRKLRGSKVTERDSKPRFGFLNEFATDLTKMAQEGQLGPVIGRNNEIRRLVSILSRLSKNNAVLLGDPGVGKTAIAEGLALRIIRGEVPEPVTTRVFNLDLGALLATTACKSAYEQILEGILKEIAEHEAMGINVILFMDELSQITIGGYRADGTGIDAATLMKPFLGKGKLRCVGCSTFEDYKATVEKDGALARQFSAVYVCEPTVPETIEVLRGMKETLQKFHGVQILDDAFTAAAAIATQYFAHKRLPDAAIDLIDEACAATKIGTNQNWEQLGLLKRRKVAIEMDIRSLELELDEESDSRLNQARSQMAEVEGKMTALTSSARAVRPVRTRIQEIDQEIRDQKALMAKHGQAGERQERIKCVQKIFELRALKLEEETKIQEAAPVETPPDEASQSLADSAQSERKPISKLTVAQAAKWYTYIPAAEPRSSAKRVRLVKVFDNLSRVVVAQPEAVEAVSSAVRCMMGGLSDPARPVASFLFGGPSGSGKSMLTKELASFVLQSSGKLLRINGSDYATPHSITRLIGTPVCTGFDQGGQLTECVRRKPFSIVHIHDIENACPEFRLKIQTILDEGSLKDGAGKTVDFRNCIVVMTTSIGQATMRPTMTDEEQRKHFQKEIQNWYSVEFLSRVDETIIFNRISAETITLIIDARLEEMKKQLSRIKLHLEVEDSAKWYLESVGWSPTSGARQLESVIRAEVLRPLATLLLEDRIPDNWVVSIRYDDDLDQLAIEAVEPQPNTEPPAQGHIPSSPSPSFGSLPGDDLDGVMGEDPAGSLGVDRDMGYNMQSGSRPPVLQPQPHRLF